MTIRAGEALATHMHIQISRGLEQAGVQIAMLDAVPAAAVEVTCATIATRCLAGVLRDLGVVRRKEFLAHENLLFGGGIPGAGGEFLVGAGLVVTDQTVNILLVCEIELGIFPAVAYVAAGTAGPVAIERDAVVVQHIRLPVLNGFSIGQLLFR